MKKYTVKINDEYTVYQMSDPTVFSFFDSNSKRVGYAHVTPVLSAGDEYYNSLKLLITQFEVESEELKGTDFGWEMLECFASHLDAETRGCDVHIKVTNDTCWNLLYNSPYWTACPSTDPLRLCQLVHKTSDMPCKPVKGFWSISGEPMLAKPETAEFVRVQICESQKPLHSFEALFTVAGREVIARCFHVEPLPLNESKIRFEICYNPKKKSEAYQLLRDCDNYALAVSRAVCEIEKYYKTPFTTVTFYSPDHEVFRELQREGWSLNHDFSLVSPSEGGELQNG